MSTTIGLVGVGRWGRHILRDLRSLDCDVVAVARSAASIERARDGGAVRTVASLDAIGDVDGYVVAVSTPVHARVVADLVPAGRPIFCEKPLADRVADLDALPSEAADLVFCMDKWRYHGGIRALSDLAASGRYGAVQGLSSIRVGGPSPSSPVSALWHLAPHDLSIAYEILGALPEPVWCAQPEVGGFRHTAHAAFGGDPWMTMLISERRNRHVREIRLTMEDAEVVLADAYDEHLVVRRHGTDSLGEPERVEFANPLPLYEELAAFVGHVRGTGPPPRSSFAEARAVVAVLERLDELAGVTAQPVTVR